jgi:glycerophosphoryl diester phosphodiesterase
MLCLYLWLIGGRVGHPALEQLKKWSFAHRGLHDAQKPENSMAAFRAALEAGLGIELDLHLMKDGNLGVIHDSNLQRVANADVRIEDLTAAELENYRLEGTEERIPLFREVLELFSGKAPLIVELKPVGSNHGALCQAACDLLASYQGVYCMESFDPRCVRWLKQNRPELIRGQLAENSLKTYTHIPWILRFVLTYNLLNFWTSPDFIAYQFDDRNTASNYYCRRVWKLTGVSWTLRTKEDFDTALKEGWIPIFEGFEP